MSTYSEIRQIGQGGFAKVFLISFANGTQAARKVFYPNQDQPLGLEGVSTEFGSYCTVSKFV